MKTKIKQKRGEEKSRKIRKRKRKLYEKVKRMKKYRNEIPQNEKIKGNLQYGGEKWKKLTTEWEIDNMIQTWVENSTTCWTF